MTLTMLYSTQRGTPHRIRRTYPYGFIHICNIKHELSTEVFVINYH